MIQRAQTIAEIGELALIEQIKAFCAEGAVGDDAAIMRVQAGYSLVVTTDMLSENVHFSDRTTPPYSVGWRATAANLSDLAAMGADPIGITVALGLPPKTTWAWTEDFYRGVTDCLSAHGGEIFGGDLCRAEQQIVSITALGEVKPQQAIRRDAASVGMTVVVSGPHGASRAGLAALLGEIEPANAQDWIRAHQMPVPRFDAVERLRELNGAGAAITGMDSSDGLANALLQLSASSQVGMDIRQAQIPLPPGLSESVGPETALEWALYGGEDFELVLCLPPDLAQRFVQAGGATAIGTTTRTNEVRLFPSEGGGEGKILSHRSFQHF